MRKLLKYLSAGKREQDESGLKEITPADRVRALDAKREQDQPGHEVITPADKVPAAHEKREQDESGLKEISPADKAQAAHESQDLVDPASIEPEKPLQLYSFAQVGGAAFFGGSIAAGWLLALNFGRTQNPKAALNAMLAAVVITAALGALVDFLPSDMPFGEWLIPVLTATLFEAGYRKSFAAKYSRNIDSGGSKASYWKAAGVTLAAFPVQIVLFVVFAMFIPITAMNELPIYDNSIYYEGRATRSDAEQLGEFLTNQGFLYDGAFLYVVVEFPKDQIDDVIIKADIERPTEESERYLAIVQLLEAAEQELYPAKQVSFEVTGIAGRTIMHITAD